MKNIFLILTINLFISISSKSQISFEKRVEIDLIDGYNNEAVFEFGKDGFIMSSKKREITSKAEWKFEKYNTELKLIQTKNILLDDKFSVEKTFTNDKRLHFLFKDRVGNFSIVTIESSDLKVTQVNGAFSEKGWLVIEDMSILGDYAFFSVSIKRSPFLYLVNWKTGEKSLMPILVGNISPKKMSIINLQVLEGSNELVVTVKAKIDKRKSDLYVIHINNEGSKEDAFNLTKNVEENIIDVSAFRLDEDKYIYTGNYSTVTTSSSEGLLFCQTDENKIDFIEFYSFLDLENFLSYLPEKSQRKIEKKKEKKEKKGKELKINYKIASHEIIVLDDGYLFLGEAYYPSYRRVPYKTHVKENGRMVTKIETKEVFDGYQYTHALLVKFDKKGKLLWDEIFEMWPAYKPLYAKRFISIIEKREDLIKLVFASGNNIISKSIDFNGFILQDIKSEEIQTNFEGDKVKSSFSNINHWYENFFIAYGNQKIKNLDDKTRRRVYFFQKIKFEN